MTLKKFDFHPAAYSIDGNGVKDFLWPVGHMEIDGFRDAFIRNMSEYLEANDIDNNRDAELLWLLNPQLIQDVMRLFMGWTLVSRLKSRGMYPAWQSNSDLFEPLAKGLEPLPHRALRRLSRGINKHPGWRKITRWTVGPLLRDGFSRAPKWTMKGGQDTLTFSGSGIIASHARGLNQRLVLGTFDDWFGHTPPLVKDTDRILSDRTLDIYTDIVQTAFAAVDRRLPDFLNVYLRSSLDRVAGYTSVHLDCVERHAASLPVTFWSGTSGLIYNRIFARAVKRHGGKTMSFDHGTSAGWWDYRLSTPLEMNYTDTFVTFSEAMARGLRQNMARDRNPGFGSPPEIVAVSAPIPGLATKKLYDACRGKSALYVSTVYPGENTWAAMPLSDMVLTDLQSRMFATMNRAGWQTDMKPHPESLVQPPACFGSLFNVKQVSGSFFEAIAPYSVLVFDCSTTTAMCDALRTNKPIVLIDYGQVEISPEARPMIERRVKVVRCSRNEENRVVVDWDEFLDALENAHTLTDDTFFDTYFRGNSQ